MDVWVAEMASGTAMSNFQLNIPSNSAMPVNILPGIHAGGITAYFGVVEQLSAMYLWHDGTVEVLTGSDGTATLVASITVASGTINSFTVSPDGVSGYATVVGSTKLYVLDLNANKVVNNIDFGTGAAPYATAVSPISGEIYVLDSSRSYHTVNPSDGTYTTTGSGSTDSTGKPAVTPDGTQLWIPLPSGAVAIFDTHSNTLVFIITKPSSSFNFAPMEVVFSQDGTSAYILDNVNSQVYSIKPQDYTTNWHVSVGRNPQGLSLSPFGSFLLVANSGDGDIQQLSTANGAQLSLTDVGMTPVGALALNEATVTGLGSARTPQNARNRTGH